MNASPTRRIRNGDEYLRLLTARKQRFCEAQRSGCATVIQPGDQYVLAELPPNSDMGNVRWWRMPICVPCGQVARDGVAEHLFGYAIPITEWLIWSNHHQCWWGANGSGYRSHIADAGRYAKAETGQWLGRGCGCCQVPEVLVPVPATHVLTNPDALGEYARNAPRRATRDAIRAGRVSRHYNPRKAELVATT